MSNKFKKGYFFITVIEFDDIGKPYHIAKIVKGYLFDIDDVHYGIYRGLGNKWILTELSTGAAITYPRAKENRTMEDFYQYTIEYNSHVKDILADSWVMENSLITDEMKDSAIRKYKREKVNIA